MRKHLEKNKKDIDAKFRLNLKESRIHRLTRYYRKTGKVPANFKYKADKASAIVSAIWLTILIYRYFVFYNKIF